MAAKRKEQIVETGPRGRRGKIGATGARGATGPRGHIGARGPAGRRGPTGAIHTLDIARLTMQMADIVKEPQIQLTRIAQLQAQLDRS
jgi:hypothetical protein